MSAKESNNYGDRYQSIIDAAVSQTIHILRTPEGRLGISTLAAVRRVSSVFGLLEIPYTRIPDIQFDLSSYEGRRLSDDRIYDAVGAVQRLAVAYYNVAEWNTRFLVPGLRRYDHDWTTFLTQEIVEQKVLQFENKQTNSREVAEHLKNYILGNLRFLPHLLIRNPQEGGEHAKIESFEEFDEADIEGSQEGFIYAPEEDELDLKNFLDDFSELARTYSLRQIFFLIERLDHRGQAAVLARYGYGRKGKTLNQYFRDTKTNFTTYKNDLVRAINNLTASAHMLESNPDASPLKSIRTLVREAQEGVLLRPRTGKKLLAHNSTRAALLHAKVISNKTFLVNLTTQEKAILLLAMDNEKGLFRYTAEEIGLRLDIVEGQVTKVLKKLADQLSFGGDALIDTKGKRIRHSTVQYQLIHMKPTLSNEKLRHLSPEEIRIFEYMTSRNDDGYYPNYKDVVDQFHLQSPFHTLKRVLSLLSQD